MRTSPSSSSTMSTSITLESPYSAIGLLVLSVFVGFGLLGIEWLQEFGGHGLLWHGQGEEEPRAAGEAGVEPDPAAEVVDDLPGHGQADAGTGVGRPLVQSLEDHEDALRVLGFDTDPVVAEREQPERLVPADGNH